MKYKFSRKKIIRKLRNTGWNCYTVGKIFKMLSQPAEWPEYGCIYWYLNTVLDVVVERWGYGYIHHSAEKGLRKIGNCFRTKKEAIKARDKIKKLLKQINDY